MACVTTQTAVGEPATEVVHRSCPNHSLTLFQARCVFWSLVVVCLGPAAFLSASGYWLVLPFAGLEVGVLAWAFEHVRRRADDFERLSLVGDVVILEWQGQNGAGRREFNRFWVRVECECSAPARGCHVRLVSHGRGSEIGRYLSDEKRVELAKSLKYQLGLPRI